MKSKSEIKKPSKEELFNILKPQCDGDLDKAKAYLEACNSVRDDSILYRRCIKEGLK